MGLRIWVIHQVTLTQSHSWQPLGHHVGGGGVGRALAVHLEWSVFLTCFQGQEPHSDSLGYR